MQNDLRHEHVLDSFFLYSFTAIAAITTFIIFESDRSSFVGFCLLALIVGIFFIMCRKFRAESTRSNLLQLLAVLFLMGASHIYFSGMNPTFSLFYVLAGLIWLKISIVPLYAGGQALNRETQV